MVAKKVVINDALFSNIPSQFTVCKAIEPSSAVFSYVESDGTVKPLTLSVFQGVGSFSSSEHGDPKSKKKLTDSNPYKSDVAYLPPDAETLIASTSLKVMSAISSYERCNDRAFQGDLETVSHAFYASIGGTELAKLYVNNLLNCTWLHRNRLALNKEVTVSYEALDSNNQRLTGKFISSVLNRHNEYSGKSYTDLVEAFRLALAGKLETPLTIDVNAEVNLGFGSAVYPSQLWQDVDKSIKGKRDAKKGLFIANRHSGAVGLSAPKVGNGLRTIDKWHGQGDLVIAVSPYGLNRKGGEALRTRVLKNDLYTLLSQMMFDLENTLETIATAQSTDDIPGSIYYVMASLVRGGVLSFNQKKGEGSDE
ncbi:type I-F CRISPR-associated protein Cas7f/Csy3 [Pseudomonas syringae pv. actinidiae]|nr:type I-F CRISPR-associated protein Cas7f/Csy3 [Pseudomonas syringae pv. actinidiae]